MDRRNAAIARPGSGGGASSTGLARALGRALATLAVAVALFLWCAAESVHPAGAWMDKEGDAPIVVALAALILTAACASGLAGLAFSALAAGAVVWLATDATFASRLLAGIGVAALCYAMWQHRAALAGRPPAWLLATGAAVVPPALWLLVRVDAAIFAAALGAFLTAYVLYAFMRAGSRGMASAGGLLRAFAGLPEQRLAASLALAVSGFGLIARVL